jgi:hypothetical protein
MSDVIGRQQITAIVLGMADGTERRIDCDGLILSGRFVPETGVLRSSGLRIDPYTQGPEVDLWGRGSLPHVYAAGNVLRGVETAGWSWAEGRKVADAIAADLARAAPAAGDAHPVRLTPGAGIARLVPQTVVRGATGAAFDSIQVRLGARLDGHIEIRDAGTVRWRRKLRSGPERRVLVPVSAFDGVQGDTAEVAIAEA